MAGITPMIITTALFMHNIMAKILLLLSSLTVTQARTGSPFELIHMSLTDHQTELSGSILLQCRDATTAEPLDIDQTKFWLNRTSACDPDVTVIADIQVIRADNGIKFNLTRDLEGVYTCGRLVIEENEIIVKESNPMTLISLQTLVPVSSRSVQTTFTTRVGDTAVLTCPIPPGALSQFYSVIWMKDGVEIIRAVNPQTIMLLNGNSRLDLDGAYSLVIHSVNLNDSSSNYRCRLFVTNPISHTKQEVQSYPDRDIPLILNITGLDEGDEEMIISTLKPTSIVTIGRNPIEQPSLTIYQQQDNTLFIGLLTASICVSLMVFVVVSIGLVIIVVCWYRQTKGQKCTIQQY